MVQVPVLAIHGGAGTINREALSAEAEREYRGALQSILEKGRTRWPPEPPPLMR